MHGSNTPTEFIITPENLLETLMTWLPGQFEEMRLYRAGAIKVQRSFSTIECQYMQTIGGEKFRVVDCTVQGDSGSCFYESLGDDDNVILDFARRIERSFESMKKFNDVWKDNPKPIELKMVFTSGPFDKPAVSQAGEPAPDLLLI